jgi:hypothetical protein
MTSRAEEIASRCLRTILAPLAPGAAIEDSNDFRTFQDALVRVIPSMLAETYSYWRYQGLDGFLFDVARKLSSEEAEFVGLCLLVDSHTWVQLQLRLRIASQSERFDRLDCRVGELENHDRAMPGTPYGSTRETKALYSVEKRLASIQWAYVITR